MPLTIATVGVVGAGAWGTALAQAAARAGQRVTLWARDAAEAAAMQQGRENRRHLPGARLDPAIMVTSDLAAAAAADAVVLGVPAQALRDVAGRLASYLRPGTPVVIAAKGLERATGLRLSAVLAEAAPAAVPAVLSGPSFAADVGRGLPTAVTIAATDETLALALCRAFAGPAFRPYAETDIVGVELGGALKNVLAIAAGVVAGRGLGASAQAAVIARGFAELRRFAEAAGARPETMMGLSGLGDLVLTCSSRQSRNFSFGIALGEAGVAPAGGPLVEGLATAAVASEVARRRGISMPITDAVAGVVAGGLGIDDAVESLMARPLRREAD